MKEKAYGLCKQFVGGAWKGIMCNDMVFKRISGGLTNLLYYCGLPSNETPQAGEPREVLLRMYGKIHKDGSGDAVVKESVIFMLLSERLLGPKLYGIFNGGRLEEYIPFPSLNRDDLKSPVISYQIAEKLARVHNINAPINKEPKFLYNMGTRWLKSINNMINRTPETDEERQKLELLKSYNLESEFKWLWSVLQKSGSPIVFSHNDVQEGNILYNTKAQSKNDRMIFIDFEFCGYNFREFDFANHFLEWVYGYDVKTSPYYEVIPGDFPTKKQQLLFLRHYLMSNNCVQNGKNEYPVDLESDITEEEEEVLFRIQVFMLASHIFWALWGYINAYDSKILFGYWDYAEERMVAYFNHKKHLLETDHRFRKLVRNLD